MGSETMQNGWRILGKGKLKIMRIRLRTSPCLLLCASVCCATHLLNHSSALIFRSWSHFEKFIKISSGVMHRWRAANNHPRVLFAAAAAAFGKFSGLWTSRHKLIYFIPKRKKTLWAFLLIIFFSLLSLSPSLVPRSVFGWNFNLCV